MTMPLDELTGKVNGFISDTHNMLHQAAGAGETAPKEAVIASLERLIQEFGIQDYGFNLVMEQYVRICKDLVYPLLNQILEENRQPEAIIPEDSDRMKVAFAAYYALSLIYKKDGNIEALALLADEELYPFQALYPLAYEVQSRYYKRVGNFTQALRADDWAMRYLGDDNIALGISFASTVCMMYENGCDVRSAYWHRAEEYIDAAINYNPQYSKYPFLRGKLIFYSSRHITKLDPFRAKCEEALQWIIKAQQLEFSQKGKYRNTSLTEYQALIDRIDDELEQREAATLPFKPMSAAELQRRIEDVLHAGNERECRPPNPQLAPGQPFFFVSYAHADFKAVYCDLLRLYAQQIPFQYDGDLSAGDHWEEKVHEYLNKPECLGVVFYISRHTPLSEAVETECRLLDKTNKLYFSVNLEGNIAPTEILFECIRSNDKATLQAKRVDSQRMVNFLQAFHDKVIYVLKDPNDGPEDQRHMRDLLSGIKNTFKNLSEAVPAGV